jgi:LacI family transcriptional regulator
LDDLSRFCCQNTACPDHGHRDRGNLSVCMRYGPDPQRRLLYCKTCKARFSERKGTPLFDARLPEGKLLAVLAHLADGCGVRQTARLVGVSKDTVTRLALRAGDHARQLHDELAAFSPSHRAGAARREVVVRREEAEALRPHRRGGLVPG